MAEQLTLTTPITHAPVHAFSIVQVILQWEAPARISVELVGDDGVERRIYSWTGESAAQLLIAFNTVNLSTKSLQRRVFERLVADGYLGGAVGGAPD